MAKANGAEDEEALKRSGQFQFSFAKKPLPITVFKLSDPKSYSQMINRGSPNQ